VPQEVLIHTLEQAIESAYRRNADGPENVVVAVDPETGQISGYREYDVMATVAGGGHSAQDEAMRHGIARALCIVAAENRPTLKRAGFLTRDARKKERKKYGQPGARKRFQYSKRLAPRHMRGRRVLVIVGWVVFAASFVVAMARAITSQPRETPGASTEAQRRGAYAILASEERNMRREGIKDFPADPWSQDDAFHNTEYRRAKQIASQRVMSLQDVLLAMDEGMRERWPKAAGVHQKPTVPPCRPRPIH
jgi:hypothetical protein